MTPVIAIPRLGHGLYERYMGSKYASSLASAGAEVRWIGTDDPDRAAAEALTCGGLLLAGGPDPDPALYGQVPWETCGVIDGQRDRAELKILEAFMSTGKPVLGICRGHQILNVYFGGTLYQDITPIQKCPHRDFKHRARSTHTVRLVGGTKVRAIFGEDVLAVNSLHHQAVEDIGGDLVVAARSDDGFVEAVELPWHRFCIGVQWNPEHMTRRSALQRSIFRTFVTACKQK